MLVPPSVHFSIVALRKESVDRNNTVFEHNAGCETSLSARRAWIEMLAWYTWDGWQAVALRKESVDRNLIWHCMSEDVSVALRKESVDRNIILQKINIVNKTSLSARRAWIEIPAGCWRDARRAVALRKESVDRNRLVPSFLVWLICRSPQGERG